jgi:Fe2+ or Zn2+ uptake regulation protein
MDPAERFRVFLALKGRRLIPQLAVVADLIFALHGTFSAEDVVARVIHCGVPVSRATIFRTLHNLVQANLLRRVDINGREGYAANAESNDNGDKV